MHRAKNEVLRELGYRVYTLHVHMYTVHPGLPVAFVILCGDCELIFRILIHVLRVVSFSVIDDDTLEIYNLYFGYGV